ncbi:hypothetical protein B0H10DRAFT_1031875 [Mycena sp. CBHHK59/15]|nr:hypothetical protein B0H10DRAFT_1031875 [Mycena sp. CBHHK59/15]
MDPRRRVAASPPQPMSKRWRLRPQRKAPPQPRTQPVAQADSYSPTLLAPPSYAWRPHRRRAGVPPHSLQRQRKTRLDAGQSRRRRREWGTETWRRWAWGERQSRWRARHTLIWKYCGDGDEINIDIHRSLLPRARLALHLVHPRGRASEQAPRHPRPSTASASSVGRSTPAPAPADSRAAVHCPVHDPCVWYDLRKSWYEREERLKEERRKRDWRKVPPRKDGESNAPTSASPTTSTSTSSCVSHPRPPYATPSGTTSHPPAHSTTSYGLLVLALELAAYTFTEALVPAYALVLSPLYPTPAPRSHIQTQTRPPRIRPHTRTPPPPPPHTQQTPAPHPARYDPARHRPSTRSPAHTRPRAPHR